MNEHKASRTLVKSPPELWAECSDATSLTRHLDQFGEIKITKLEPETTVAWEGDRVSGTVRIEPSGWGTRVTLTATPDQEPVAVVEPTMEAEPESAAVEEPEPAAVEEQVPEPVVVEEPVKRLPPMPVPQPRRGGLLSRLFGLMGGRPAAPPPTPARAPQPVRAPEPVVPSEPAAKVEPEPVVPSEPAAKVEPEPVAPPEPVANVEPEPPAVASELADLEAALGAALDSLGQAHHRPFSRA